MATTPGVFVLALSDVASLLTEDCPRVVKAWASTGGYWAEHKRIAPGAYIIARQFWRGDVEKALITEGRDPSPLIAGLIKATTSGPFDAWLGPNEYIVEGANREQWLRAIRTEKEFAAATGSFGLDYWALSMSTHNLPPMWVVEELARDPNITGLSLHLYSLERAMPLEPEVARYKAFIAACPLPVLIGETGRDGIGRNIGWQQQGVSAPDFAEEMRWLTENLGAWAYTTFAYGCTQDWKDKGFEVKDNVEFRDLMRTFDYSGFKRPERRGTVANWAYELGFADYAKQHPEIGLPMSALMYDAHGNGFQFTENGKLEWNKAGNQTQFFAAATTKSQVII